MLTKCSLYDIIPNQREGILKMNKNNKYSVAEFQIDMENITPEDVELYNEISTNYGFPGSYTNESSALRENIISNVLDHQEYQYMDVKSKSIIRLAILFSEQNRFDDLYLNGLSIDQIAFAYKTSADDVTKKIIFDSAKQELKNNKYTSKKSFC